MPDAPVDPDDIRDAVLALEGTVIEDLRLPLPGDLKDIAKAAALVSGVVEDRIPEMLNRERQTTWDADEDHSLAAYEFRKFPIGFPDVLLVERADPSNVIFEIEAKSWYILSSDPLTARFETAESVISEGTLLVVAAWMLDGVVSGSPKIMRIYVDDARRVARGRDTRWEATGEDHRVTQPNNPPGTPRNLLNTQVRGEIHRAGRWVKDADNFGKLDRLYDPDITRFRDEVWQLDAAGKTLDRWRSFIKEARAEIDDADLDAAQQQVLALLGESVATRDALIQEGLRLGVDPKKIATSAGVTRRRVELFSEISAAGGLD